MNEITIPLHRAVDKEWILERIKRVGARYLDPNKAEELGVMSRISNLLCAIYNLNCVSYRLYGEIDYWFTLAHVKRHEIKRACMDMEAAYDRWFKFWRGLQTTDGVKEFNNESADLLEQFMGWAQLPVHWEFEQRQNTPRDTEPMIELDRGDRIWRIYRDIAKRELIGDVESEWAVMRCDRLDGRSTMTCVERGMDKASAQMSAKRLSANDQGRLYTASKFETITEKRLEIVPIKAFIDGEMAGDIKNIIKT